MKNQNDLYTTLLFTLDLLNKYKNYDADTSRFQDEYDQLKEIITNSRPIIAQDIYQLCDRIKADIDLFESEILGKYDTGNEVDAYYNGIRSTERVSVFLMGEFSAGKTTLIRELIGEKSGPISAKPETSNLIIHQLSKESYCEIYFHKKFCIDINKGTQFRNFLRKHDLYSELNSNEHEWLSTGKKIEKSEWSNQKIQDFIDDSSEYSEAFNKIVWKHPNSQKKLSSLKYIDLYDFPGTGGNETHTKNIQNALTEHRPDIIFYLIDTDQGVPSDDAANSLMNILDIVFNFDKNLKPKFYWAYSKPSNNSQTNVKIIDKKLNWDESFFNGQEGNIGKREALLNFIDAPASETKKEFTDYQKDYLKNTSILDLRNKYNSSDDDTSKVNNAIAMVLREYFIDVVKRYTDDTYGRLENEYERKEFELINFAKSDIITDNEINYCIEDIIKKIKNNLNFDWKPSYENCEQIFIEMLHLEKHKEKEYEKINPDLQVTIDEFYDKIKSTIDWILKNYLYTADKKKFWEYDNEKNGLLDITKLTQDFSKDYSKYNDWKTLFYRVQAYHWLRLFYDKQIEKQYLGKIGSTLLSTIIDDFNKLKNYNCSAPYIAKL